MRFTECQIFHSKRLPLTILCGVLLIFAACSQSLESHLSRGEEYLQKRKYREAEMQFRAASNIDDTSADAHWGLARSYEKQGKFLETVQELKRVAELAEGNLEAKAKLGNYYLLFNPPQTYEAEKIVKDILSRDPNFIEGHILKASILSSQGRSEKEIVDVLRKAISLDENRIESYLALARFYMKSNKAEYAEETIKTAISVNGKRALGYLEYGRFLTYTGRRDEAEEQIKKAIQVEPANLDARESLASHYLTGREVEKAEKVYKELVRMQENSPESRMDLANFYSVISRKDDAIKVYQGILSEETDYARARYKMAEIYLASKEFAKVKEEVETLLTVNDTDAEALMLRSRLKIQENKPGEAVKDLEEVLKRQPTLKAALFYMTHARLSLGQVDQARAFIGDLEKFHPGYKRTRLLKIQAGFLANEPEVAHREANFLITAVSKSYATNAFDGLELKELRVRGISARGLASLQLGKFDDAEKDLREVTKLSPNSASAKINLARIYIAKRELDEALALYVKALKIDRDNFDALSGAVSILTRQEKFTKARAKIDKAIKEHPDNKKTLSAMHYLRSDIFLAEKKLDSAEAELKKAIEIDEEYLPAYSAYASLLVSKNQTDAALAQYRKVVEKKPAASIYTLIGMLEDANGNSDDAEKSYRKALEISPGTPIAANNLAWMIADSNRGNLDEALRFAQETVSKNQNVAGFHDTLGWVNYKKGFYLRAVESFKKAIALDERQAKRSGKAVNSGYRLRLGMALASLGDKSSARKEIAIAIRNGGAELSPRDIRDAKNSLGDS